MTLDDWRAESRAMIALLVEATQRLKRLDPQSGEELQNRMRQIIALRPADEG